MSETNELDEFYSSLEETNTTTSPPLSTSTTASSSTDIDHSLKRKTRDDDNDGYGLNNNRNSSNKNGSPTSTSSSPSSTTTNKMMIPPSLMKRKQLKPTTTTTSPTNSGSVISSKAVTYSASTISKLQESSEPLIPTYTQITRDKPQVTMEESKPSKYVMSAAGETWEDDSLIDWDPNGFRIFVGHLGNDVTDDMLIHAFSKYPSFQRARVIKDKKTSRPRGYGFVSLGSPSDYVSALREMNGKYLGSRPLVLKKSSWKDRAQSITPLSQQQLQQHNAELTAKQNYTYVKAAYSTQQRTNNKQQQQYQKF